MYNIILLTLLQETTFIFGYVLEFVFYGAEIQQRL